MNRKLVLGAALTLALLTSGCTTGPLSGVPIGVYLGTEKMSDKSEAQVKEYVQSMFANAPKTITLVGPNGKTSSFPIADIGISPDVEGTTYMIWQYADAPTLWERIHKRFQAYTHPVHLELIYRVNPAVARSFFKNYAVEEGMDLQSGTFTIDGDKATFLPSKDAKTIDVHAMVEDILDHLQKKSSEPIQIRFRPVKKEDYEQSELKEIDTVLAQYTSYFNPGAAGRTHNIEVAVAKVNGTLLSPGEIFSYNNTLGERTSAAGYESAPVLVNGKLVPGIGGGICQLSSTIYAASLYAGMDIIERTNHFEPISYMPIGLDATVSYGDLDFAFKNPFTRPIYLMAQIHGNALTVYILGNRADKLQNVSFETVAEKVVPNKTIVKKNEDVKGKKIIEEGHTGVAMTTARRMVKADGSVTVDYHESYYDPLDTIVEEGKVQDKKTEDPTPKSNSDDPIKQSKTTSNTLPLPKKKVESE